MFKLRFLRVPPCFVRENGSHFVRKRHARQFFKQPPVGSLKKGAAILYTPSDPPPVIRMELFPLLVSCPRSLVLVALKKKEEMFFCFFKEQKKKKNIGSRSWAGNPNKAPAGIGPGKAPDPLVSPRTSCGVRISVEPSFLLGKAENPPRWTLWNSTRCFAMHTPQRVSP